MNPKTKVSNRIAAVREQCGLSAAQLARAVNVSRQTIYAVEAGSYVPNTETGLRMARALGVSVNELFSLTDTESESKPRYAEPAFIPFQQPVQQGQPVQLCKVNRKLVAAPAEPAAWCLPASDGVVEGTGRVRVDQDDAEFENRVLIAGCDPAMGRIAHYLEPAGIRLVLLHQNSSRSLALLKGGYAHVAGCHLGHSNIETVNRLFPAKSAAVFSFASWQEGLVTAPGNPKGILDMVDLARKDVLFLNREEGSGTRALLDRHINKLKMDSARVRGYQTMAAGHLAAAWEVKKGKADCCLSTGAAARFFGLHFVPLETIRYDLVIRRRQLNEPGTQALLNSINSLAFRKMLTGIGGYDTSVTGNRVV